ncbi:MAG TPA: ferredoxin [Clostridia bacterium]|nr:ferredoxin [Clostridia bacterium]
MKVTVDPDLCIACGACIDVAPELFDWNDDGLSEAIVDEVPEDQEDLAREAIDSCPTEAILES